MLRLFWVRNPDGTTAFGFGVLAPSEGRNGGLDATPTQLATKIAAVIGFIRHQLLRSGFGSTAFLRHTDRLQCGFGQLDLVMMSRIQIQPNRQAIPVTHHHHFGALAHLRLAYAIAPFLAGTKLPSRNACTHSILSAASNWLSSVRQICSHTPSSLHSLNRRQQVAGEPYCRGTSPSSAHTKSHSACLARHSVDAPACSPSGESTLRLLPIVRRLSHVCSSLHFILTSHF
jgi:hypothetical protein